MHIEDLSAFYKCATQNVWSTDPTDSIFLGKCGGQRGLHLKLFHPSSSFKYASCPTETGEPKITSSRLLQLLVWKYLGFNNEMLPYEIWEAVSLHRHGCGGIFSSVEVPFFSHQLYEHQKAWMVHPLC